MEHLERLLAMPEDKAYDELARLNLAMSEDEWRELCDEYASSLYAKHFLNKE